MRRRRSRKPKKGIYEVKNKEKYIGKKPVIFRSGWELKFMVMLDEDKKVLSWSSESIKIPYYDVTTRKARHYIPDFYVETKKYKQIIEIKPKKETFLSETKTVRDKLRYRVNIEKWKSAKKFCKKHGFRFRVITEGDGYFGR